MPDLVESDFAVGARATTYQALLTGAGVIAHLFQNNVTPDPSFVLASFSEANYSGYVAQFLAGSWSAPVQVVPGQYLTQTGLITFPTGPGFTSNTVYGVFVTDALANVIMSFRFASPILVNPLDPPILAQLSYNFWARVLLP